MVQDTNRNSDDKFWTEDNRIPESKENQKLQPEDNNTQSLNANNNDTDIQESTQGSNTRSINESGLEWSKMASFQNN